MAEAQAIIDNKKVVKTITSQSLFGDAHVIEIQHGTETYQLRVTKTGKLILTK